MHTGMGGHNLPTYKCSRVTADYDITQVCLGSGISGKVFQCVQKASGRKCALKVLSDDAKARREVELHCRASECPNVVKVLDVYENSNSTTGRNHILLIMECMEGGELFNRIQSQHQHGFTENDAAQIVYQIANAIAYLHRMNIAHRDLKPENLLFASHAPDAPLKLIDFGFAKEILPGTYLSSPCFTPYYVAPEVFGPSNYDKRCDIWSLGVITYILLCGYPPFYSQGGDPLSPGMKTRIRNGQYTFPPGEWSAVSNEAKDLIQRLLIVEPERRLTIEQVMQHPWIARHQLIPQTPLTTVEVLSEERDNWIEVQEGIRAELQTLRRESQTPFLKRLEDSKNPIFVRRRTKAAKGALPPV